MKTYTWTFDVVETRLYKNITVVSPDEETAIESVLDQMGDIPCDDEDIDIELVDKELGYHE